ncbi:hypothetical protein H4CHR_02942 [Variovorax sp. PBS-H4]|uniref:hypothetical protein n=1 Tax=Variovorax sp. PBS-H4 TaxID=434008 RepID=UPI00131777CA|nr:hypothetical protein [Variovorax sp. PBS-H4]VTU32098.1 hypothetical protein H4CHR_02942 [Variovorax sp. PBS-H4]
MTTMECTAADGKAEVHNVYGLGLVVLAIDFNALVGQHNHLINLLQQAQNGLRWYQDMHPDNASGADDELHAEIDAAIAAHQGAST